MFGRGSEPQGKHVPCSSVFIIEGFRGLVGEGGSGAGSVEGFVFSLKQSFTESQRCVFSLRTETEMDNSFPILPYPNVFFFSYLVCLSCLFLLPVSQQVRAGLSVSLFSLNIETHP